MDTNKLITMANQIGQYFESYPEDEALIGIRQHIQQFWEPRMRKQIMDYIQEGGEGIMPLVLKTLEDN